jgi:murein DD-endopeptidase MepM/ murein hydrolase activator NlpD
LDDRTAPPTLQRPHLRQAIRRQTQRQHWRFYSSRTDWLSIQNFARAPVRWRSEHHAFAAIALLLGFLVFVVVPAWSRAVEPGEGDDHSLITISIPLPHLPARSTAHQTPASEGEAWRSVEIQRGQTMGAVFASLGLPANQLAVLLEESKHASALTRIRPGQQFDFRIDEQGRLEALRFAVSDEDLVTLAFDGDRVSEAIEDRPLQRRIAVASGTVRHSLFGAADDAGLSDAGVMQMVDIFGYDIDFARDLRRGDSFAVLYERIYQNGEYVRDGIVLGATFVNDGKRHVALRHQLSDGSVDYFDQDGRSLRKAFLRTPVEFSRISSGFSMGRMHPVLGRMRAHRGVDYAAPTGTPIRAAGKGRVKFRGWQSGYGNVVILEHGGKYTTLYGHMSRFANGLATGDRVQQGEVIGYVGMTGLATGPHLHYEFRVHGAHRDPLTVELPKSEPLTGSELRSFRVNAEPLLAQLGRVETLLAQAQ